MDGWEVLKTQVLAEDPGVMLSLVHDPLPKEVDLTLFYIGA